MFRTYLPSLRTLVLLSAAVLTPSLSAGSMPLTQWESAAGGNDHYYQVFYLPFLDANTIPWIDAYNDALSRGGYLATILTPQENLFVTGLTFTGGGYLEAWIGLTDELEEGNFVWVNNDGPLTAEMALTWAPGEPNDDQSFGGEDYAIMSPPVETDVNVPGSWNDLPNESGRVKAWIVEWDLQPLTSVPEPSTLWTLALAAGLLFRFRRP